MSCFKQNEWIIEAMTSTHFLLEYLSSVQEMFYEHCKIFITSLSLSKLLVFLLNLKLNLKPEPDLKPWIVLIHVWQK